MTSIATAEMQGLSAGWDNGCGYGSAAPSGILPDASHLKSGGYHCSVLDLLANGNGDDYSNTRPDDKNQNKPNASACDMSMSTADMALCYSRVYKAWNDRSDPRRIYINAFNGWDGKSADATRLDFYANVKKTASSDHKWHNHLEVRRKYNNDPVAIDAILSILRGETKEEWAASMGWTDADITALKARVDCLIDDEDVNPKGDNLQPEPNNMKLRQVKEHQETQGRLDALEKKLDAIILALGQTGGAGGLTKSDVEAVVEAKLNATHLTVQAG